MNRFTVEETNLLSIYHVGQRGVDVLRKLRLASLMVNIQQVHFFNGQSNHAHTSNS